jgi:ABC-2 type transport system ATP-binding protein
MPAHVVIEQLTKHYGTTEALCGVSLTIERGEIFGLLGPNGAGKTTALECLVGLREPDTGRLVVGGIDIRTDPQAAKQKIGVALQSPHLPAKITPREALRLFGALYSTPAAPDALLARFNLTALANTLCDTLSGGQQQRLALALAFVNQPEFVVLDEPTSGLDPQSRQEIRAEIVRLKADGRTVLLSTHDLDEAEQLCDRIAVIDRGRIVAVGTPRELIAGATAKQSVVLVTVLPLTAEQLATLAGTEPVALENNIARWKTSDATATLAAIAKLLVEQSNKLIDLQVRPVSLESVFLRMTSRASEREDRTP